MASAGKEIEVKQGWSVTIEGRSEGAYDPDAVMEALASYHPGLSVGDRTLSATVTVDATSPLQAIDQAHEIVLTAVKPFGLKVEHIEAMTEERQEKEVEASNLPDLVGLADIAEMLGTTRQRVFQMTANKGFPVALLELKAGRLWSRPAIESYLEGREATRRRPIKTRSAAPASQPLRKQKNPGPFGPGRA